MIVIITLERVPERALPEFIDALRQHIDSARRIMPNVWLAETYYEPRDLARRLRNALTDSDHLFVMRVRADSKDDYGGWLKQDTWTWIRDKLNNGAFSSPNDELDAPMNSSLGPSPLLASVRSGAGKVK